MTSPNDLSGQRKCDPRPEELSRFHQAANQVINDLHELFYEKEVVTIDLIEEVVIKNLVGRFTRLRTAQLVGLSERGLRNKIKNYDWKKV